MTPKATPVPGARLAALPLGLLLLSVACGPGAAPLVSPGGILRVANTAGEPLEVFVAGSRVLARLERIKTTLPSDISVRPSRDQSIFIRRSFEEIQHHLLIGGLLAAPGPGCPHLPNRQPGGGGRLPERPDPAHR